VVLGSISNIRDAVNWLSYTYLYIRMRRNFELYGVNEEECENDPTLIQIRINLAHTAALKLNKAGMIKYDRRSGTLLPTAIGKVASHYYIKCDSMQIYNEELKPHMSTIDLFRLFALSKEFENIPIRENEKVEL
jgi:pre-mRNA-splicing helicase BRR2